MKNFEKFIVIVLAISIFLMFLYCWIFLNIRHSSIYVQILAMAFTIVLFVLFEKYFLKLKKITKSLILLFCFLFFGLNILTTETFRIYPTIAITNDFDKAIEIQKFIGKNFNQFAEINSYKDENAIFLHTKNHKVFDKIAIAVAQSDLFDDTVKIGVFYKFSEDAEISRKRLEKCFENRINLIKDVKSTQVKVNTFYENEKPNPDLTTIEINVDVSENADKNKIYKTINNFLPMPNDKKTINIR